MILLVNKKDNTRAIFLAESDSDIKVLSFLYETHVCWGFYQIAIVTDSNKKVAQVAPILKLYPNCKGIGWLHSPTGFVEDYQKRKIE